MFPILAERAGRQPARSRRPAADARDRHGPDVGTQAPRARRAVARLAPIVIGEIGRTLRSLRETGLTVLLVEQNARLTCSVASRIYISAAAERHHTADRVMASPELLEHLI